MKKAKQERDYCLIIDGTKYNRNMGCKTHDNAYGINGGGKEKDRYYADKAFFEHLKNNKDPWAGLIYITIRLYGWIFFNYHGTPWNGQLVKKIWPFKKK